MKRHKKIMILCAVLLFSVVPYQIQANACCQETELNAKTATPVIYMQDPKQRYPQTILYDLVLAFLNQPHEKQPKVLVLGYDGFREDALTEIMGSSQSGISLLVEQGGIYPSYAGADGQQSTSTAPGWASILTGRWAYEFGVVDNDDRKPHAVTTFLDQAKAYGMQATFLSSWSTHFDTTYLEDIEHPENEVVFQQKADDEETVAALLNLVKDPSSAYDMIFGIFEYSDHAGHTMMYGNEIPAYVESVHLADEAGYAIISSIYERSTYDQEDWLIIITTDHGGLQFSHGGQSEEERNTWFAMNHEVSELLSHP